MKASIFLSYLSIVILRPRDIVRLSKKFHVRNCQKENGSDPLADAGLNELEESAFKKHLKNDSDVLILGCGTGRESLALAKRGFRVAGVDMVEEAITSAREHAKRHAVAVDFFCNEFSELSLGGRSFDCAFFSLFTYEQIPSRRRRVKVLQLAKSILKPSGKLILHFNVSEPTPLEKKLHPLYKTIALLTLGNVDLQVGDRPSPAVGFTHAFTTDQARGELREAGFNDAIFESIDDGAAVCVIAYV